MKVKLSRINVFLILILIDFVFIDAQNCHRKLGIFPNINKVWVTVDKELFLWDYSKR